MKKPNKHIDIQAINAKNRKLPKYRPTVDPKNFIQYSSIIQNTISSLL
jgi:hypothetical protein